MMTKTVCFLALLVAAIAHPLPAQQLYRSRVVPHWFAEADGVTNKFWYRINLPDGKSQFITVNAETGRRETSAERLGANGNSLPSLEDTHPSRQSQTDTDIVFSNRLDMAVEVFWVDTGGQRVSYGRIPAGGSKRQHTYSGHVWLVTARSLKLGAVFEAEDAPATAIIDLTTMHERRRASPPPARSETISPDGKWDAVVHDHNLFLRSVAAGTETPLTTNASPRASYARNGEYDRAIDMNYDKADPPMPTPEVYWSPDSKHLVAMCATPGTQRKVSLVESSPEDQLQPKLISISYLKPGDDVPVHKPHLFAVGTPSAPSANPQDQEHLADPETGAPVAREIPLKEDLFANPWTIDDIRWDADSSRFTFLFNQRGHQALRLLAVDAGSGAVTPIINEESKTFVDYSGKFFCEHLDDSGEILWMSERDGWNHLYLYDAKTGAVKNQVTRGEWVVRSVDLVDRTHRQIWFQAGGIVPGQDPYYLHACRVNFDGTGLVVLTPADGTHTTQFSPDRNFVVDTWSRINQAPVTELRRGADGQLVCKLEEAQVEGKLRLPEPFVAKGRDGQTDIYGAIWFPADFNPKKKYAVIEDIYAGPQDSFTPKEFSLRFRQQKLADRGFIVVQMDGMGTSNRSKKFHDVCWKNLRDAGFPDRLPWIRAAAKKFPCLDLSRVGIFGTSAGGQDALRAVLDHGDFYRACVADSGCYDNRMDKIWWNEQWLGWPVDESYTRCSCVVDAPKLRGKLLLMAGELDKNVDPASTMQVVNALVKANKPFEMFIMPGMGHGVLSTDYGWSRLVDFFERNLGGPK